MAHVFGEQPSHPWPYLFPQNQGMRVIDCEGRIGVINGAACSYGATVEYENWNDVRGNPISQYRDTRCLRPYAREYGIGALAYFPSEVGLVPCIVAGIEHCAGGRPATRWEVLTLTVKADRGDYRHGQAVTASGNNVIPRAELIRLPGKRWARTRGWRWGYPSS